MTRREFDANYKLNMGPGGRGSRNPAWYRERMHRDNTSRDRLAEREEYRRQVCERTWEPLAGALVRGSRLRAPYRARYARGIRR